MSENKVPEEIEKLVKKLTSLTDESQIVEKLQEILEVLLTTTELRFTKDKTTVIVKPLEIEAYYYNEGVFKDECVHVHKLQKNRQGKVYIHRYKSKAGESKALRATKRAGMDLVLSDCNCYALAFLIRDAEIYTKNDKGEKQICCSGVGSHPANLLKAILKNLGFADNYYENLIDKMKKQDKLEIGGIEDKVVLCKCEYKSEKTIDDVDFSERVNIFMSKSQQNDKEAKKFKEMKFRATFRRNSPEN